MPKDVPLPEVNGKESFDALVQKLARYGCIARMRKTALIVS